MAKRTCTPASCDRIRATTVCTSSSTAAGSRAGSSAPARIFARSIRLPTTRLRRSVSSSTVVSRSRCCAASCTAVSDSRLVTDALIDASGVRRSCVTLENSAARIWLVSASSCALRTRMSSRARSIARAACFAVASRSACSVAVNACAPGPRTARTIPNGISPIAMGTVSIGPASWWNAPGGPRSPRSSSAVEHRLDLASDEVERIEQGLREVVEDARELLAREELGGEVAQESRVALSPFGSLPLFQHARDQEPHDERDQQEHDGRHHVFHGRHPERVARRGEEEDVSGERQGRGQQPAPHPRGRGGEDHRQEVERDRRDTAGAVDREREARRDRREPDRRRGDPGRGCRSNGMPQVPEVHGATLAAFTGSSRVDARPS